MPLWNAITVSRTPILAAFAQKLAQQERERDVSPEHAPQQITGLLDQLAVSLRAANLGQNATLLPEGRLMAADLGEASAEQGRDIEEVVSDFLALHEAILEVGASEPLVIDTEEHRVLARGINRAIATAVARYAEARDDELRRAHAEHFAFLAHELRTPLSNIKMGIDLLDEGLDAAVLVPRVRRSAERMRELLDNEITSARLAAGSSPHLERVDLGPLLETVVEELRMQAHDRDIELALALPEILELRGDPRLLRSIFTNLIANAVKFTKKGGRIVVRGREEAQATVCEIADSCGGLPEGKAESLFVRYQQHGEDRSGFGLGLSIVSEAVAVHDGTITVENRPGEGCTMVVRFPRSEDEQS